LCPEELCGVFESVTPFTIGLEEELMLLYADTFALAPEVDRVLASVAASGEVPADVVDRRLLLAAGHALPALPGRMRRQSERRRYVVVQPATPACAEQPAGTRAPCRCLDTPAAITEASCASTHGDEHDAAAGCRVRIDDDHHQIVVLHRTD
ncbi:MAG TPA: hypothetical protein VFG69_13765, partial [Nannocystaceae bacterium]|nr:hypothetical protein [Nannocystaceae bacterium]